MMDFLTKMGPLLGQIAPTIATALGGPLAGLAVKTLSGVLLGNDSGTAEEVSTALAGATPDQLAAVKKIDADFSAKMKELDIDLQKIYADDRDSARKMQIANKDWVPKALAIVTTVGFFLILDWLLAEGMPKTGSEALLMMLGSLGTAWVGIINFYYGSSAGSEDKNHLLANKDQSK